MDAPGPLGGPIDYYKFKRWVQKRKVVKEILKETPDISREELKLELAEWEENYNQWEEADYKKWKQSQKTNCDEEDEEEDNDSNGGCETEHYR